MDPNKQDSYNYTLLKRIQESMLSRWWVSRNSNVGGLGLLCGWKGAVILRFNILANFASA